MPSPPTPGIHARNSDEEQETVPGRPRRPWGGDQEAEELAHDGLTGTLPGGARLGVVGGSAGLA